MEQEHKHLALYDDVIEPRTQLHLPLRVSSNMMRTKPGDGHLIIFVEKYTSFVVKNSKRAVSLRGGVHGNTKCPPRGTMDCRNTS